MSLSEVATRVETACRRVGRSPSEVTVVADHADNEAEIIFGALIDDDLGEEMKVTVIAAGFDKGRARRGSAPRQTTERAFERGASNASRREEEDDLDIPNFVQG